MDRQIDCHWKLIMSRLVKTRCDLAVVYPTAKSPQCISIILTLVSFSLKIVKLTSARSLRWGSGLMQSSYHISFPFQLPAEWQWAVPWRASGGRPALMWGLAAQSQSGGEEEQRQHARWNTIMTSQMPRLHRGNRERKSDNLFCVFFHFHWERGVIGSEGQV